MRAARATERCRSSVPIIDESGDEFEDRGRYHCSLLAELAKDPAAGT
jgi:hypothetical protein